MSRHLDSLSKLIQRSESLAAGEKTALLNALKDVEEETQTKDREIETYLRGMRVEESLEKVRSKTMTMHNSQDVAETVAVLFDEMIKLGVKTIRCGIGIMKENMKMEIWTSNAEAKEKAELIFGLFDMNMHPMFQRAYRSWQNKEGHFSYDLAGDDLIAYYNAVNNMPDYKTKYNLDTVPKLLFHNSFTFAEGTLFVFSLEKLSADMCNICHRFAGVFGQTYRRFLDLQEAEEQKSIVEEKHKEILDSIYYAKRIQLSLLPTETFLIRAFNKVKK
ncbi:MAG TPA: hypothetical protein VNY73_01075 [Bacteroidia bacterium]|jgi:hypothetical protein|nr:hypothetical protein [Bacteroidia bacterium]